jgi:hypothetical protein
MGVDEAGHEGGVAKIEDLGSGGMRDGGAGGGDALAFDENLAWGEDAAGVDFEEAGGVEDDGTCGGGLLRGCGRKACGGQGQGECACVSCVRHPVSPEAALIFTLLDLAGVFFRRYQPDVL